MIQKIQSTDYLKRLNNMTADEKDGYLERVGEWLDCQAPMILKRMSDDVSRFQNVLQCGASWNDDECKAWTDGAVLLTALAAKKETWLPDMLYVKAARQAIRQMVLILREIPQISRTTLPVTAEAPAEDGKAENAKEDQPEAKAGSQQESQTVAGEPLKPGAKAVPARPTHIDQYVHLLPKKTQERAAMYAPLMRELEVARENARTLMDAGGPADKIESWAKAATNTDEKIKAIRKELDDEWDKLVKNGTVTVDEFGNAHVTAPDVKESDEKKPDEKDAAKKAEDAKRVDYLKKWLRDTRTAASDERRQQWEKNCRELLELGGEMTDSIRKAAEFYGVDLAQTSQASQKQ